MASTLATHKQKMLAIQHQVLVCSDRQALTRLAVVQPRSLTQNGHIVFVTRSINMFKQERFTVEAFNSHISSVSPSAQARWFKSQLRHAVKVYGLDVPATFVLDLEVEPIPYPFRYAFYVPFDTNAQSGGLLYTRSFPWTQNDQELPLQLTSIYAGQWAALA